MSRIVRAVAIRLMVGSAALVMLAGCTAISPGTDSTPSPGKGSLNETIAYKSAWRVTGGGEYVMGSADVCNLYGPISIEDHKALANPDSVPIFGFVLDQGTITYGTVWPTAEPGTGIVSGAGTYVVDYDSAGEPTAIRGIARVKWHDASATPVLSTRSDVISLRFTKESRAEGKCDF
jgi:hypothetical protein